MLRKAITLIVAISYCMACGGCYRKQLIQRSDIQTDRTYRITEVVRLDGEVIRFVKGPSAGAYSAPRWATIRDSAVVGWVNEQRKVSIPLSDITAMTIRKNDSGRTFLATIGVIVGVGLVALAIAIATKESCPFVYSFDGENYWFDGEPYGGATCPALQRTDYCRLDSLREVDGKYKLRLSNEVDETQHTDELKLWVVDHPPEVQVIPDAQGRLYTVSSLQAVTRATSTDSQDVSKWLRSDDPLRWESDMSKKDPRNPTSLRDSLILCFAKPAEADNAKLVANVGTTLWGSQMLKRHEELWGDQLEVWRNILMAPMGRLMLDAWDQREEAYRLQVRVWVQDHWDVRGELLGGGPFLTEDRVAPLDLAGVQGDSLYILLTPPVGFWQMNWFAVDYSSEAPITVQEIEAESAFGHEGNDLRSTLVASDGQYYSSPDIGQTADLCFAAPPPGDGLARTVFAKVSGYYDIHHDKMGAKQDSILSRIREEPGYYTRYALEELSQWLADNSAPSRR